MTKFGGQPRGLAQNQWPISRGWKDRPMMFIAQIQLDGNIFSGASGQVAYLFMTHKAEPSDDFFDPDIADPEAGESALIINSAQEMEHLQSVVVSGPTLFDRSGAPYEGTPRLKRSTDPEFIDADTFREMSQQDKEAYADAVDGNKVGGTPNFFQADQWPGGDEHGWKLLLQLNANSLPFDLNIGGAATLFAFVSPDYTRGCVVVQDC